MFKLASEVVVYDTEYTAWEGSQERGWTGPGEYREIVQIGAVKVRTDDFQVLDEFLLFVKPVKNPALSEYFMQLTGITQAKVDEKGISLALAIQKFAVWGGEGPYLAYGRDAERLEDNAKFLGISFPFQKSQLVNVREVFKACGVPADDYMSSTILRAFGREPILAAHNGLDDAKNVVEALRELSKKG